MAWPERNKEIRYMYHNIPFVIISSMFMKSDTYTWTRACWIRTRDFTWDWIWAGLFTLRYTKLEQIFLLFFFNKYSSLSS